MPQVYRPNAKTNQHLREIMQKSNLANVKLANIYNVNYSTFAHRFHYQTI